MDLLSLEWPAESQENQSNTSVFRVGGRQGGLGGAVIWGPAPAPKYKKLGNALWTHFEIKKIEEIEKPLSPEKEKEQRELEPPPQVEVTAETLKEKKAEEATKSELTEETKVQTTPKLPKKKKQKRTLF